MRVLDAPVTTIAEIHERIMLSAARHEAILASQVPSAFWLDATMPRPAPVQAEQAPCCPNSCGAPVLVLENEGPVGSLWSCTLCGVDYGPRGRARWRGLRARRRIWREVRRRHAQEARRAMLEG